MRKLVCVGILCFLLGEGATQSPPPRQMKVQEYNNLAYRISNFGAFANSFSGGVDTFTTLFFPKSSRISYSWIGSLWIGAVADTDTICHVGYFGSCLGISGYEQIDFVPDTMLPGDTILMFNFPEHQLATAHYTDTIYYYTTEADPKNPLHISVRQLTYAFNEPQFEDFITLRFLLKNIGPRNLTDVYLGLWNDAEAILLDSTVNFGFDDDITGFLKWYHVSPTESIRVDLAWVSDNDGDPSGGAFDSLSITGINAFKVLFPSPESLKLSYNWWCTYDTNTPFFYIKDWGPVKQSNFNLHGYFCLGPPLNTGLGSPGTQKDKYSMLSNGEIDYNSNTSHIDHTGEGWLPPHTQALNFANGIDVNYVLSVGPFNLSPGESTEVAFATLGGENFQTDPNGFDSLNPQIANYNFSDLVTNALAAQRLYDSLFNPSTDVKDGDKPAIPRTFTLYQNYPNPFNSQTRIPFTLLKSGLVKLEVYNLLGQKVATLAHNFYTVGIHNIIWDGKNDKSEEVASGIYFYILVTNEGTSVRKMTLLK